MYDLYFRQIYEMELLTEFHGDTTVTECHFYGNGVACMTSEGTIRVVEVSATETTNDTSQCVPVTPNMCICDVYMT